MAAEAGIILPILFLLGFGAVDASLLFMQTHRMEAGLTAGGSYLAAGSADTLAQSQARNIAVSGSPTPGADSRIHGWTASDVNISLRSVDNSAGEYRAAGDVRIARLTSSTPFKGFGLLRGVSGGKLTVTGAFETRIMR